MDLTGIKARKFVFGGLTAAVVLVLAACSTPAVPAPITTTTLPPAGVHTSYVWNCQAAGAVQVDVAGGITVSAPATVNYGDSFTINYVIDPITIPSVSGPATISAVGGWNFRFTIPANSSFVGATVTGGQGYSGTATVGESGGSVLFAISGAAPANGTVDYPIISVTLKAEGISGSEIKSSVAGTSYATPGLSFVSDTNFGSIVTVCFPYAPVPIFSTTGIVGGPSGVLTTGVCYSFGDPAQSFEYLGPANVLANSRHYTDSGSCSTTPVNNAQSSIMSGQTDQAGAAATCTGMLPGGFVSKLSVLEPITPVLNSDDYWGCFLL